MDKEYYLITEYCFGDFSEKKWALFVKNINEGDEVVLWKTYSDTPGYPEFDDEDKIDEAWAAIDKCIEEELGFLPDYLV